MEISFHGADLGVTGSCHLVQCGGQKILIDCGLYQGGRELNEENREPLGFDPAEIDYLLLTHAHLDHCGRLPLLVNRGFRGEIITTAASRELAKLVMLDAAGLQEEEAERQARRHARHGHSKEKLIGPLYTTLDALNSLDHFGRTATYGETIALGKGVQATFSDAGHILGSASVLLELEEGRRKKRVLFSGDLGYQGRAILRDPNPPSDVDVVVMETTYGDRLHKTLKPSIEELYEVINSTFAAGGNVIIPTFALERAQEILYYLREGIKEGSLSGSTQVFLDSPMAISATEIFRRHPECYDKEACDLFSGGQDPFNFSGLHFTRQTSESMALNRLGAGAVIMAGSGMCTGGRVRHHLKHHLWRKDSSIVFVGFAARGTLARLIVDGAKEIRLFGEEIPVRANIHTIGGFSAHADRDELLAWHRRTGSPGRTFLVHGEQDTMESFAAQLSNTEVIMPDLHEAYSL
ncbi:metallo-beta-lactamase family protein [Marinobacter sp. es.048]|uniref:MBL fold metallo-hydrolase RNA specificity domain-containing protein n=1 Tax=Marinobacter sp. es.048 TaxID=1761795 RepID=UPI000B58B44A|nr:MBL fold metallo-hydrolase [Marinobacter sp. es.048]SNC75303.1 metallo-beta-lactamase family protein [Marinobacter sp. es.048]